MDARKWNLSSGLGLEGGGQGELYKDSRQIRRLPPIHPGASKDDDHGDCLQYLFVLCLSFFSEPPVALQGMFLTDPLT
jgi:hypothetical protein